MADYKTCVKHDMDLCPMARRFANNPKVRLDCSRCKDYRSSEKQCGDCKHYDARDAYCGIKHESIFFREKSAACYYYEERQKEISVRKSCYTCKHYKNGLCSKNNELICTDDMSCWELSDNAKADVLHDAETEHEYDPVEMLLNRAKNKTEHDAVNSPAHYTSGGIECIDCIKAALGDNFIGFLIGNVFKYCYRYRNKNGVTDLKKAAWYLDRAIKEIEDETK